MNAAPLGNWGRQESQGGTGYSVVGWKAIGGNEDASKWGNGSCC